MTRGSRNIKYWMTLVNVIVVFILQIMDIILTCSFQRVILGDCLRENADTFYKLACLLRNRIQCKVHLSWNSSNSGLSITKQRGPI